MDIKLNMNQLIVGGLGTILTGLVSWLFNTVRALELQMGILQSEVQGMMDKQPELLAILSSVDAEITEIIWKIGGNG